MHRPLSRSRSYAGIMATLRPARVNAVLDAFLSSACATPLDLRRAVLARAQALSCGACELPKVPSAIAPWVDKVTLAAQTATDDDVAALVGDGYSEDAILEITEAAALGASLARLDAGLAAIREA
jgi:alkylhydroperoxidase family enzyme